MSGIFGGIEGWLAEMGLWAYVLAPTVMAAVAILPIPAEAPAMANGALFGPVVGSVMTWAGAMAGAWISYELAGAFGRPLAGRFVSADRLRLVDTRVDSAGWIGLLTLRLIPVAAFTAINWGAGLCGVPRGRFLWTTGVGILPGVIVFTSSGAGFLALFERSPWIALGVLMAVAVAVVFWLSRRRPVAA